MCFDNFIKKNCFFHDFTEYIHFIEEEFGNIETIIKLFRNKRMGKSLFLDAFNFYFDIGSKDQYECLFKGLKVFDYQSNFRNNMYVLKFDFSILNVESDEKFNQSLNDYTNVVINLFLNRYPNLKLNKNEIINDHDAILSMIQLRSAFAGNLLILIDEYDCPISTFFSRTNLIYYNRNESKATNTKLMDTFKRFFQTVKSLRNQTGAGKSYVFLTGVSPQALDNFTSGFNVGLDISQERQYSEILGYSEEKVWEGLRSLNIPEEFHNKIFQRLKDDNNGYRFCYDINTKTVYNPTKINYCFANFQKRMDFYYSDNLSYADPDEFLNFLFRFPENNNTKPSESILSNLIEIPQARSVIFKILLNPNRILFRKIYVGQTKIFGILEMKCKRYLFFFIWGY